METSALRSFLFFISAALLALCSRTVAGGANVSTGTWGGQHIVMTVTNDGAAVEFDCAHGTVDTAMTLDANGHFDATGTFTPERAGPTRDDRRSPTVPARYSGSVRDDTLTLTVVLTKTTDNLGEFTLKHGSGGRLFKCR